MDVIDVHVVVAIESARPDPNAPIDPAALLFEPYLTETRDLGGGYVADATHHATITLSRCYPTKHCPTEPVTLTVGTEAPDEGDTAFAVQWPWAWVEPPPVESKGGATWSGTRKIDLGLGPTEFAYECTLSDRRWKGGQVRCAGAAAPIAAPPCAEAPCMADLGSHFTLDVRLDWVTGSPVHWKHTGVSLTVVNGDVARRTVTTTAKVSETQDR